VYLEVRGIGEEKDLEMEAVEDFVAASCGVVLICSFRI